MFSQSAPSRRHWLVCALACLTLPWLSGCLVIEKKTLVMVVPRDSKEVRMYYVFEGLSCLRGNNASLDKAKTDLEGLKKDDLSFFVFTGNTVANPDDPLLKQMRFDPLRFYTDPARKRSLCAERKVTIVDRDAFARFLNEAISAEVRTNMPDDPEVALDNVKRLIKEATENKQAADELGMGALVKAFLGLALMAENFDRPSLRASRSPSPRGVSPGSSSSRRPFA